MIPRIRSGSMTHFVLSSRFIGDSGRDTLSFDTVFAPVRGLL